MVETSDIADGDEVGIDYELKQARKLQDAQAEKLISLHAIKLTSWQRRQDDKMARWQGDKMTRWQDVKLETQLSHFKSILNSKLWLNDSVTYSQG